MNTDKKIEIWSSKMDTYKLIDSGGKEKLEEINGIKIVRKEPRAWWSKKVENSKYSVTKGQQKRGFETIIDIGIGGIKAKIKFRENSKHIGIFPEQFEEWKWINNKLESHKAQVASEKKIKILNLFGYTGIASLVAAKSGAKITHVDASKQSIEWAKENQKLSELGDAKIRWIVDDVIKFLKREIKRGEKYDAIIMDPPSYGKGPKGEVWKIEDKLPELLKNCKEILNENPLFIILNMYSTELSSISVGNLLSDITEDLNGQIEIGELAIEQKNSPNKLLPMSIFAIWKNNDLT